MGTTTIWNTGHLSAKEFVEKHVFSDDGETCKLVDISVRGNVAYCAVRSPRTGEIFAAVVRLVKDNGDWNHRDMEERSGPYYWDCPARILDKLSPTDHEYALEWRKRCRDRLAQSKTRKDMKPGTVIRLEDPVTFSDGVTESEFTCDIWQMGPRKTRKVYRRKCDNTPCRINLSQKTFSVL
jgi:hypothetical protein